MSTEDPKEPVQPRRVAQTPPSPAPLRRTIGFWSIPVEAATEQAAREFRRTIERYVEPISDEEAASFGVPPIVITPAPEAGSSEDLSFTEERFGEDDVADMRAVNAMRTRQPSGPRVIAAPRLGVRRP